MSESGYALGFEDAQESEPLELSWVGKPPEWLKGTLFRNGPGRYDRGKVKVSHWFDGLALLHSLALSPEGVRYRSHFVRSHDYRTACQSGTIASPGFACDPCRSLFRKVMSAFVVDATDNPNVSLVKQGEHFLALTELPIPMEFDPVTLRSVGPVRYNDKLPPGSTTAHPHQQDGVTYNQVLHYSGNTSYRFYGQRGLEPRQEIAKVSVPEASYVHSFGITEDWFVLTCSPFQVAPLKLLLRSRPFIENFDWKPRWGTRFHLLPRSGGRPRTFQGEPFFCFHHVNSFQAGESVFVDLVAYPDASIIEQLKLEHLESEQGIEFGYLRRYRIDLNRGSVEREWQCETPLELPRISYQRHNTREYRYVYGVSASPGESSFYDRLAKVDVKQQSAHLWVEPDTYPGEPILVLVPEAREEDDGVLLSVVLSPREEKSFLLVLCARTMQELARAWIPRPVPHGFHGLFERDYG